MNIEDMQNQLAEDVAAVLDTLCTVVYEGMAKVIAAQLEVWKARYPRHTFSAAVGHGRLSFTVEPKVCDQEDLVWIPNRFPIRREAEDFVDFFNTLDRENIGVGHLDTITR